MSPDHFNALFEFVGGCLTLISVYRLYFVDRAVKGVSPWPVAFFSAWGLWNIYYYPTLGQFWSFAGGVWLVTINTIWVIGLIRFSKKG